jgi:hypothetical protein
MGSPGDELLRLAQTEIGIAVALERSRGVEETADLKVRQEAVRSRMRALQRRISFRTARHRA